MRDLSERASPYSTRLASRHSDNSYCDTYLTQQWSRQIVLLLTGLQIGCMTHNKIQLPLVSTVISMRIREFTPLLCVGLHALLALAHLALLGVWAGKAERSIVTLPGQASTIQTYISLASQIIIIVRIVRNSPSNFCY